jgi:hypothetical protein
MTLVDLATIYRIRRGQVVPYRETMQAIITASGGDISVEDLVHLDLKGRIHHLLNSAFLG